MLGTFADLLLVVFGFGLIVFAHELGHFVAARWAGVRVLAFALGFGPAIVSYRRGLGWRRGSSEAEYHRLARAQGATGPAHALSPTEYRVNWLPFGGYVKMLGQEDANPAATSDAPDSYQSRPIWKRMVVISAGVLVNLLLAFVLFIVVFMAGLPTEPAAVGAVRDGSPAARAVPLDDPAAGVGLRPGDLVLAVNDSAPNHFNDVMMKVAVAHPGDPVRVEIERAGKRVAFQTTPEPSPFTGLLDLGFEPPRSLTIDPDIANDDEWARAAEQFGLDGVEPGMRLVNAHVGGGAQPGAGPAIASLATASDFDALVARSGGAPIELAFRADDGKTINATITPNPEPQRADADPDPAIIRPVEHLLGLRGLMRVEGESERGYAQGLRHGDVFTRIGGVEYPAVDQGIAEIRRHAGKTITLAVLRAQATDAQATDAQVTDDQLTDARAPADEEQHREVTLEARVARDGTIGFNVRGTDRESTLLAAPLARAWPLLSEGEPVTPPAAGIFTPGMRVLAVAGRDVRTFADLRDALRDATRDAAANGSIDALVPVRVELATGRGTAPGPLPTRELSWRILAADVAALHALGWEPPFSTAIFAPEEFVLRATGPAHAVVLGVDETRRMLARTYLTLARLAQGSVKIEHLQGPVGIAHVGTRIADRGLIWLTFFLALLSVNLAVINFLPLPIVDGGQFLMLLYEQLRGRPVPIPVQGAITMAGLALIGTLFLVVTFNDVSRLLDVLRGP